VSTDRAGQPAGQNFSALTGGGRPPPPSYFFFAFAFALALAVAIFATAPDDVALPS
jgi:hypothetical protein